LSEDKPSHSADAYRNAPAARAAAPAPRAPRVRKFIFVNDFPAPPPRPRALAQTLPR